MRHWIRRYRSRETLVFARIRHDGKARGIGVDRCGGIYFHHGTPGLGPALQAYKSPDWVGRAEWGAKERDRAVAGMRYFDEVLTDQPYVAGEKISMADITVLAGLMFAGFAGIAVPPECDALAGWQSRMSERSSVKHPA